MAPGDKHSKSYLQSREMSFNAHKRRHPSGLQIQEFLPKSRKAENRQQHSVFDGFWASQDASWPLGRPKWS